MEESGVFEYWFALIFALGFAFGSRLMSLKPRAGEFLCGAWLFASFFLFLILPLINVGIAQESLPFVWNTMFEGIAGGASSHRSTSNDASWLPSQKGF